MESLQTYERRRYILSLIPKEGISVAQLAVLLKVAHESVRVRLREYMLKGHVFVARAKVDGAATHEAWYFTDRDACMEFRDFWHQKAMERKRLHDGTAWKRAKPETKARRIAKVKAKRALGRLEKQKGTRTPKPEPKPVLQVINPNNVQPTVYENNLRSRYEALDAPPCFSSLRPGQYIAEPSSWVRAVAKEAA